MFKKDFRQWIHDEYPNERYLNYNPILYTTDKDRIISGVLLIFIILLLVSMFVGILLFVR